MLNLKTIKMNINFIKKTLLLFALSLAIVSCDHDDQTGDSQLTPTNPSVNITLDFLSPAVVPEDDSEYEFMITLSNTNVVDTKIYVEQIGGTADDHDYEVTHLIVIPAGYTTGSGTLKILADEDIEDNETLMLQIGDQRTTNSQMTPQTIDFVIQNVTSDDLVLDLSWAVDAPVYDADSGDEIGATTLADLRLLITDVDGNILDGADGGSFETYVFSGLNADDTYQARADFYSAEDYERMLDLTLEFNQTGKINHLANTFESALDMQATCPANVYTMASFTKMGGDYEIEWIGEGSAVDPEGTWTLEMNDSWGDGWDGAYLTMTVNGVSTDYTVANGYQHIEMVDVPADSTVQISYTAGSYEEEHSYVITAPDGTVYADGPNPAEGTVVDSENICL